MKNFLITSKKDVHYIYYPILWEKGVIAATSLRLNGTSPAPYKSLNLALHTNDSYLNIIINRKKFFSVLKLNYKNIVTLKQIHSNIVVNIEKTDKGKGALNYEESVAEADGMVTSEKNIPLVIFTADCIPIFFFETKNKIIGIAHAGWKGSLNNIVSEIIKKIVEKNGKPENIIAILGPGIKKCCYEIKNDLLSLFDEKYITNSNNKFYLDLYKLNIDNLINSGVLQQNIYETDFCTSCNVNLCFSYRKEGETGRMASVICMK